MSAATDYLEAALMNHLFRGTPYTAPANIYVGLFTTNTSDSGGGTEVSGGGYARVQVASNTSNWSAPGTAGQSSNVNAITFPTATANWGTVVAAALFDAPTGGNMLVHSTLNANVTVNSGQTFSFAPGAYILQIA